MQRECINATCSAIHCTNAIDQLPRDKQIITFCKVSLRGYEAPFIRQAAEFNQVHGLDGGLMMWPFETES